MKIYCILLVWVSLKISHHKRMTFMGQIILGKGEYCPKCRNQFPQELSNKRNNQRTFLPETTLTSPPPSWTTPQYMQNWTTLVITSLNISHTGSILDLNVLFNNSENAFVLNGLVFLHVLYGAEITFYLVMYLLNNFAELFRY